MKTTPVSPCQPMRKNTIKNTTTISKTKKKERHVILGAYSILWQSFDSKSMIFPAVVFIRLCWVSKRICKLKWIKYFIIILLSSYTTISKSYVTFIWWKSVPGRKITLAEIGMLLQYSGVNIERAIAIGRVFVWDTYSFLALSFEPGGGNSL